MPSVIPATEITPARDDILPELPSDLYIFFVMNTGSISVFSAKIINLKTKVNKTEKYKK